MSDLLDLEKLAAKLRFIQLMKIDQAEQLLSDHDGRDDLKIFVTRLESQQLFDRTIESYRSFVASHGSAIMDQDDWYRELDQHATIVFEGAQGVLLDPVYGFTPHVTATRTTLAHAEKILERLKPGREILRLAVTRAFSTRHGAGPFVAESPELTARLPDRFNPANEWQGRMRAGHLDLVALKYALKVGGSFDALCITSCDRMKDLETIMACRSYLHAGRDQRISGFGPTTETSLGLVLESLEPQASVTRATQQLLTKLLFDCQPILEPMAKEAYLNRVSAELGLPIAVLSHGPAASDKEEYESV